MKQYMILTVMFCLLLAFPGCGGDEKDAPDVGGGTAACGNAPKHERLF